MNNKIYDIIMEKPIVLPIGLLEFYTQLGLTSEEVVLILQFQKENISIEKVAKNMNKSATDILSMISILVQRNFVIATTNEKAQVVYSFQPLFKQLAHLMIQNIESKEEKTIVINQTEIAELMEMFSKEFGRELSSMEFDMIGDWLQQSQYSISLIKEALREAVLSDVHNLKYMDRILLEWERKGITTVEQVKNQRQKFKREVSLNNKIELNDEIVDLLSHDWLNNN